MQQIHWPAYQSCQTPFQRSEFEKADTRRWVQFGDQVHVTVVIGIPASNGTKQ